MSIASRITFMLLIALLGLIGIGLNGLWGLGAAQQRFEFVQGNAIPGIQLLDDARDTVSLIRIATRDHALTPSMQDKLGYEQRVATLHDHFNQDMARFERELAPDEQERAMLAQEKTDMAAYMTVQNLVFERSRANDAAGLQKAMAPDSAFRRAALAVTHDLAVHMDYNAKLAAKLRQTNQEAFGTEKAIQIGIIVLAAAIVGVMGYRLAHMIRFRLNTFSRVMEEISSSLDFTARIEVRRQDELGRTATSFNALLQRMRDNLSQILSGAREVAVAADQLKQTAGQVADAATRQSESSATMAATVEQMTVSINHVADRAHETFNLARDAGTLAREGGDTIGQTIHDIHEISTVVGTAGASIREMEHYSSKVGSIISVIGGIAEQTNLLALNAAIEAARAGEQGRGFAVVADEVRKLAERTTLSTQEIATTIDAMVQRSQEATTQMQSAEQLVNTGVGRADVAAHAIEGIGAASHDTAERVSEITQSIQEQGSASNAIALQVEQTAQMSEQSSAAAEQTSSSAMRLNELAQVQIGILEQYTL